MSICLCQSSLVGLISIICPELLMEKPKYKRALKFIISLSLIPETTHPYLTNLSYQEASHFADAYFNLKVKKMFIFIEGQHFNTLVSPNKVYTAPHFPFYDFRINLGIVWYLFS